ncbi:hypothetical protein F66182_5631, partial [Fusarium sp. NRRL 66182]
AEGNVEWHPKLFRAVRGGPGGSEEGEEDLDWIINAEVSSSRKTSTWLIARFTWQRYFDWIDGSIATRWVTDKSRSASCEEGGFDDR